MARQHVRRKISSLRRGPNARKILGPEEDARALWRSYKKHPLHPFVIKVDGTIVDAGRRHWGAELEGDVDSEVDCLIVEGDPKPEEVTTLQLVSAIHRADISPYDKAVAVRDIKVANPGTTNKQLAEEVLNLDPSMVTRLLSLFDCIPAVQDAAKAGLLGITDWYPISKAPDQEAALTLKLNGANRDDLDRESRKQRNGNDQPAVRVPRIRIPLATDNATGKVTIDGVPGEDIDLEDAETLLKEALTAVRAAKGKNLDTKTAQAVWRDVAKAGA